MKEKEFDFKLKESETPVILHQILDVTIKKMRTEGVSELRIAQESYNFAAQQLRLAESRQVIYLNQIISKAIEEMAFLGQWSNLGRIAKHALEDAYKTCESLADEEVRLGRSDKLNREMAEFYKLEHEFVSSGVYDYVEFAEKITKFAKEKEEKRRKEQVTPAKCSGLAPLSENTRLVPTSKCINGGVVEEE